jgi:hypothetical protein
LFDFYCDFGTYDKDGKVTGIFRRAPAVRDSATMDISWADFQAMRLKAETAKQQQEADAMQRGQRVAQVDTFWASMFGRK